MSKDLGSTGSAAPEVALSSSPFVHDQATTPWIMFQVLFALVPVLLSAVYFFGLSALLLILVCVAACLLTERVFEKIPGSFWSSESSLSDGSALLTGVLLALTLPPGFPLWMAFLGGVAAIGMGKVIWGGLGQNLFNPALLGRAFLQAAFPTAITTWSAPDGRYFDLRGTNLALPFMQGEPLDAVSGATPLALMKFQYEATDFLQLLLGSTGGSLGETAGGLILLSGVYLAWRRILDWRIPVSIFITVVVVSGILFLIDMEHFPSPWFMLFSGGLMLGAVFMATDPVTSPYTPRGCWIFGLGIGSLVVLIRVWGGLPEGVMYAILLMNSVTPLINRVTRRRVYGT
ncbi:MAG: RnfABCDGE type electron transport complex subunit D [SAR324 cluster bacterium]|jgi:electron transport complex protein RnfD|nr:electron transporter RnfD [Deltaproteobacteria bacterium]MDP6091304.1 RnfABCDGE type electron transport complex subunit D [SAR324 cluster bacterium]MBP43105.1 electron transporter RnfD [Deltaproteobacteria bacterium]MDP6247746.1 RnfABCDGE type electron transport complex subunit D [SAR324 cluster bacterium]MDP7137367.1 RnfABCDGE type electron transport complex subunit D [SAR324 cluster bacterium]|tara:strand:+ start:15097 stop:16131 length:1035 start_codon:yes stop_codon:yes gene_type:complete